MSAEVTEQMWFFPPHLHSASVGGRPGELHRRSELPLKLSPVETADGSCVSPRGFNTPASFLESPSSALCLQGGQFCLI